MILASLLLVPLGVVNLVIAAFVTDYSAQFMGLGLLLLAWGFALGYHGYRIKREARRKAGH